MFRDRFVLYGYIVDGVLRASTVLGAVTFTQVFQMRPDKARFAVAGHAGITVLPGGKPSVLVWDFSRFTSEHIVGVEAIPPAPRWVGDNLDALVMRAVLEPDDGE